MTPAPTATPTLSDLLAGRLPDPAGRFGPYGGRFVPETLMQTILDLESAVRDAFSDADFQHTLARHLTDWVGRPTPLTHATSLADAWGTDVWLKREDLAHTGAHKINNAIGQALLARRIGATRVVAETGAGQHGVATAAACARVGLPCTVFMGAVDMERQQPNALRIRQLGADLVAVDSGDRTLRAAIDEAIRTWVTHPTDTYYLIGSAVGPHPYPWLVRELQCVIGREARAQIAEHTGGLPDTVAACVGGGSNAIGLFHPFLDTDTRLIGFEAGGPSNAPGHAATLCEGTPGVLHGSYSILLQNDDGQIVDTDSISAGLDYPGVGPEHAFLRDLGRVAYEPVTDEEALNAAAECCELEGILPALESAHALAGVKRRARTDPSETVLIGLSGRGDKDMQTYSARS